jgi:hypothetical protein
LFNVPENDARINYYQPGNKYVPTFRFDGQYIADPSDPQFTTYDEWYDFVRQTIDSLLAVPSPIRINVEQYVGVDSVHVSFDIVCVDPVPSNLVLHFAVAEWGHYYVYPGIPTIPKRWYHAMRDLTTGETGMPITLSVGDSLHYDWTYPIFDVFAQDDAGMANDQWDMTTIIFIQDDATHDILQAFGARLPDVASVTPGEPARVWLGLSTPNPFSAETAICFGLDRAGAVRLSVYAPTGQLVTNLVDGYLEPGPYSTAWDGCDRFGREVGSGMYYYKLETVGGARTGRVVLLK